MRAALLLLLLGGCLLGVNCGGSGSANLSAPPTTHVNPPKQRLFTIPSSGMEPTLHCAKGPAFPGCLGKADDRVLVDSGRHVGRGDILVFRTPPEAAVKCGEGGVFVKRVIGLPGDTVHEDANGFIDIDGKRLAEPYLSAPRRLADSQHFGETWHVPQGEYFMLGDNRPESCDSRVWGSVPAHDVIGPVVKIIRSGNAA
jgi:signal peptidase I